MAKLKIDARSEQGNAWNIMGHVRNIMKQLGKTEAEMKLASEDMMSSNYKHLCEAANKHTGGVIIVMNIPNDIRTL